ncbi:hypothetical protein BLNAU_20063 [Blattamonas nauphoetae]|uniref:Fibronectin type-III domain-containing protein n=1 Tax=Blattamonas nauphoetae TaxID=2049346 RepID=A0ABQ9WZW9_9EUKA|nr:hypothetical protein BLNAU_20063 [Blattamonas nauphoetae]
MTSTHISKLDDLQKKILLDLANDKNELMETYPPPNGKTEFQNDIQELLSISAVKAMKITNEFFENYYTEYKEKLPLSTSNKTSTHRDSAAVYSHRDNFATETIKKLDNESSRTVLPPPGLSSSSPPQSAPRSNHIQPKNYSQPTSIYTIVPCSENIDNTILMKARLNKREKRELRIPELDDSSYSSIAVDPISVDWRSPNKVEVQVGRKGSYTIARWVQPPARTLYLGHELQPGSVYFLEMGFQIQKVDGRIPPSSLKWNIGIEALPQSGSGFTGKLNEDSLAIIGIAPNQARYQQNGAAMHDNSNTTTQEEWQQIFGESGTNLIEFVVAFELDLTQGDRMNTLRMFQTGREQRKCFIHLPNAAYRFSVRAGETGTIVIVRRFGTLKRPTPMQNLLYYDFTEWKQT